ncbi:MAG: putative metal-binding motif-containing protein [Sandaracinaceae bacterium]
MRSALTAVVVVLSLSGCGDATDEDAGTDASGVDGGRDAAVTLCARVADCDDGLFCNGAETCAPGEAGAGPDGCVAGEDPCSAACDEAVDTCLSCATPDVDDDGHDAVACGGDDCDDNDPQRFPTNAEVCDAEGHDEDCDDSTFGAVDVDTDGFVSASCCNGDSCGADCDDDDVNVNPGASELCDGLDNNCSGEVDDEGSLCPGGTCALGRCEFVGWDRTFGSVSDDFGGGVAIDNSGNIYVSGVIREDSEFGDGPLVEVGGGEYSPFVVSFTPDRTKRWVWTAGQVPESHEPPPRLAVVDGVVSVMIPLRGSYDFGAGDVEGNVAVMLDASDGSFLRTVGGGPDLELTAISAHGSGFAIGGNLDSGGTADVGGGAVSVVEGTPLVWGVSSEGAFLFQRTFSVPAGARGARLEALAGSPDASSLYAGGSFSGGLSVGSETLADEGAWVARLEGPTASPRWLVDLDDGTTELSVRALSAGSGQLMLGGSEFRAGGVSIGGTTYGAEPGSGALLISLDPSDGALLGTPKYFPAVVVGGLVLGPDGNAHVVGEIRGATDFGGGAVAAPTMQAGFYVRYDELGRYRGETVFDSEASVSTRAFAVGARGSRVLVGDFGGQLDLSAPRLSLGSSDIFVLRLD